MRARDRWRVRVKHAMQSELTQGVLLGEEKEVGEGRGEREKGRAERKRKRGRKRGGESERDRDAKREKEEEVEVGGVLPFKGTGYCLPCKKV